MSVNTEWTEQTDLKDEEGKGLMRTKICRIKRIGEEN
jgi:hypothetical protein